MITELEKAMLTAAEQLDFEKAAALRDKINELKEMPELSMAPGKKKKKAKK